MAAHRAEGHHRDWNACPTCGQHRTGAMRLGLARKLVSRMGTRRRDDVDRLAAADNLGDALRSAGALVAAADVQAGVFAASKRACGKEHPATLGIAINLAPKKVRVPPAKDAPNLLNPLDILVGKGKPEHVKFLPPPLDEPGKS